MSTESLRPSRHTTAAAAQRAPLVRIGTRGSDLAVRQTAIVIAAIHRVHPEVQCEVRIIRTLGDDQPQVALHHFEGQGVFVRRIEAALLSEEIDLAVHSFKDMPSTPTPGLELAALPAREDPRDALVARGGQQLHDLPGGARIGTGSPRRRTLLLDARPDLQVQPIRGNVDTRLRLVAEGQVDAVVVAAAGLRRLGREQQISQLLDPTTFTPAIGQGILAVQARANDTDLIQLLRPIHDPATATSAVAERAVAVAVGAGCQTPVGAYAHLDGEELRIAAFLADDTGRIVRAKAQGAQSDAKRIGAEAGAMLVREGGVSVG